MSQARFWSFCWAPLFQPPTCPTSSSLCLCRVCFPFVVFASFGNLCGTELNTFGGED
ncbi:hypothetical protein ACJIZ3_021986 [Penstemon smallii]|uniref:Secreted protein n=1 Tax=Penstemon smallii TaxID=265156 RepID=A0ABD3SN79_9LAMI